MSKIIQEFKTFAIKGNAVDLAVGVVIGAAFTGIVNSLVTDIFTPLIGLATGGVDFSNIYLLLKPGKNGIAHFDTLKAAKDAGAVTVNAGMFMNAILNFLIVAFVLFIIVRAINRLNNPAPTASAPVAKECPFCTMSIPIKAKRCPQCTAELA